MKTQPRILSAMKLLLMSSTVLLFTSVVTAGDTFAQNKKGPPSWAPAHGYRAKTRHVYFPQHNVYFDLHRGVYIYMSGRTWEVAAKLPSSFDSANLAISAKIELDLDSDTPQEFNRDHRLRYAPAKDKSPAHSKPSHAREKQ